MNKIYFLLFVFLCLPFVSADLLNITGSHTSTEIVGRTVSNHNDYMLQSLQFPSNAYLVSCYFYIVSRTGGGNTGINCSLSSEIGGVLGKHIDSGTVNDGGISTSHNNNILFESGSFVNGSQTYWVEIRPIIFPASGNYYNLGFNNANPYANGQMANYRDGSIDYLFYAGSDLRIAIEYTPIVLQTITYISPVNNTHISDNLIIVYNITEDSNCSLILNGSTNQTIDTNKDTDTQFNISLFEPSVYSYYINCEDTNTSLYTIIYDDVFPIIDLISPIDKSFIDDDINLTLNFQDKYLWKTNTTIYRTSALTNKYVSTSEIIQGIYISGDLSDLYSDDLNYIRIDEGITAHALEVRLNITDLPSLSMLNFTGEYIGNPAHTVNLYIWNKTEWENIGNLPSGVMTDIDILISGNQYITDSTVQLMVNHTGNGVGAHYLLLDYLRVVTDNIYYNNYSGILGIEYYNISEILNLPIGNYTLFSEATDTHTTAKIKPIDYEKTLNSIIFYDSKGYIEFNSDDVLQNTFFEGDRYIFEYCSDKKEFKIKIKSNFNIEQVENSEYPCHFIIDNRYWFDTYPYNCEKVKLSNKEFEITLLTDKTKECIQSKSLGGLNEINSTTWFYTYDCTPNLIYTSWDNLTNISLCFSNFTINQQLERILYDSFSCPQSTNTTFYNISHVFCNYVSNTTLTVDSEFKELNNNSTIFLILLFWGVIMVLSFYTKELNIFYFACILGVVSSIFMFNNYTTFPSIISAIFGLLNGFLFVLTIVSD